MAVGDSDYIFLLHGQGRLVELKVTSSKKHDTIKVKLRREQRIKLRKECQMGNPAYMLVWAWGVAYLIPGDELEIFSAVGRAALLDVQNKAVYSVTWPAGIGPGASVRGLMDFLFR